MATGRGNARPVLEIDTGSRVRDHGLRRNGTVLDTACQYPHPQARPILQYLVRWDDGQVLAHSEGAFRRGGGLALIEEG